MRFSPLLIIRDARLCDRRVNDGRDDEHIQPSIGPWLHLYFPAVSPPSYALVLAVLWYRAAETFPWQPVPGVRQAPTPARRRVKATHTLGFLSSWGCSLSLCLYNLVGVEVLCTYRGLYCIGPTVCWCCFLSLSLCLPSSLISHLSPKFDKLWIHLHIYHNHIHRSMKKRWV